MSFTVLLFHSLGELETSFISIIKTWAQFFFNWIVYLTNVTFFLRKFILNLLTVISFYTLRHNGLPYSEA